MWEVEYTNEFAQCWHTLAVGQQEALTDRIQLLAEHGPALKRPVVGMIRDSRHSNMKELIASAGGRSLRVLFAFDPSRRSSFYSEVTRPASGNAGTGGPFRPRIFSMTRTSRKCGTKD